MHQYIQTKSIKNDIRIIYIYNHIMIAVIMLTTLFISVLLVYSFIFIYFIKKVVRQDIVHIWNEVSTMKVKLYNLQKQYSKLANTLEDQCKIYKNKFIKMENEIICAQNLAYVVDKERTDYCDHSKFDEFKEEIEERMQWHKFEIESAETNLNSFQKQFEIMCRDLKDDMIRLKNKFDDDRAKVDSIIDYIVD